MRRTSFGLIAFATPAALALGLFAAPAHADGFDKNGDDAIAAQKNADAEKGSKMPGEKDKPKADPAPAASDPKEFIEDPLKSYYYLGLRYRDIIVPKFMIDIFASGGATVNAPSIGIELSRHKDQTEIDFAVSYADYSMDPFLFKGKSDGDESYEMVSSTMKLLYVNIDLLYAIPIDDAGRWAFLIGGGVGVGGVFGSLNRNQVYPSGSTINPSDPGSALDCSGPGSPATVGPNGIPYCDNANGHYGSYGARNPDGTRNRNTYTGYSEASWANGGSKPIIFPWIALPQFSLRFKPIKEVQIRADVGFSTSGFYLGISGGYGLPIGGLAPKQ